MKCCIAMVASKSKLAAVWQAPYHRDMPDIAGSWLIMVDILHIAAAYDQFDVVLVELSVVLLASHNGVD